jgi:hypothetical protein
MSKKKLVLIVAIAILFTQNLMAQSKKPSLAEIDQLTKQIIKDNPKFHNPDLVYPGDTVLVVEKNKTIIYAVGKWTPNSENGCLWQIANLHLNNKLKSAQASIAPVESPASKIITPPAKNLASPKVTPPTENSASPKVTPPAENQPKTAKNQRSESQFDWQRLLLTLLVILVFLIVLLLIYPIYALKKHWSKLEPVIKGGLPNDPSAAIDLINQHYPRIRNEDNFLKKMSRGRLFRHFGPKKVKVEMAFSDGIHTTLLKEGEPTYCAEYTDGTVYYFRLCCGNLYVPTGEEWFLFPEGWSFIPEASVERTKDEINQEAKELLIKKTEGDEKSAIILKKYNHPNPKKEEIKKSAITEKNQPITNQMK